MKGESEVVRTTIEDLSKVVMQDINQLEERLQYQLEP